MVKKRTKKMFALNKKHVNKFRCESNCIICGLGYIISKRKPRLKRIVNEQE